MKKIVLIMAVGVVMMVGCKKTDEGEGPSGGNVTDTVAVVKHNVELVFHFNPVDDLSLDTIRKYNADPNVDTIFMIPENWRMWDAVSTSGLQMCVDFLRERHNVNPDKVFGKGKLELDSANTSDHPEIVRFFRDTLRYNVTFFVN